MAARSPAGRSGPVSGYSDGRKLEYAAQADLEADGYWCKRSPGSKGKDDVLALKGSLTLGNLELLFVQCKLSGEMGPDDRAGLLELATRFGGVPVSARWVKVGRAARTGEFRELTGPGPKDWRPWSADHALEKTAAEPWIEYRDIRPDGNVISSWVSPPGQEIGPGYEPGFMPVGTWHRQRRESGAAWVTIAEMTL